MEVVSPDRGLIIHVPDSLPNRGSYNITVSPVGLSYNTGQSIHTGGGRDNFGARYGDILTSFCQISHTFFYQREFLLSHGILSKDQLADFSAKNDNLV